MAAVHYKPSILELTLLYFLLAVKRRWVLLKFEGDIPPNRLDHSMCLLPWTVCEEDEEVNSQVATKTIHLAFVFGGMDTQGVIHNDCVVTVIT